MMTKTKGAPAALPLIDDAALLAAHEGLTEAQSHALNAQIILILANHIGDAEALEQALALAREGAP